MPFSHHSHSGEFCPSHAHDTLDAIVLRAIDCRLRVLALTEHMPRYSRRDLYPDEIAAGTTPESLQTLFASYVEHARKLQAKYAAQIELLVAFEGEWIGLGDDEAAMESLMREYRFDTFVGSVHHVCGIPIDYDAAMYEQARAAAAARWAERNGIEATNSEEMLFGDYFDAQADMLEALRPPIVAHFDLVALFSREPEGSLKRWGDGIWGKVQRNLRLVKQYGGCLEISSARLRKGKKEPYPGTEVCQYFMALGGSFVLSDDSHGIDQVAWDYDGLLGFVQKVGIKSLVHLHRGERTFDHRFPGMMLKDVTLKELFDWQAGKPEPLSTKVLL